MMDYTKTLKDRLDLIENQHITKELKESELDELEDFFQRGLKRIMYERGRREVADQNDRLKMEMRNTMQINLQL
jgi:hypothetical protein